MSAAGSVGAERALNGLSPATERRMSRALAAVRAENRRRVPCPQCKLAVLPETMARHIAIVHADDAE
jgi:hypothetical protein